jgi:hypothetical protein
VSVGKFACGNSKAKIVVSREQQPIVIRGANGKTRPGVLGVLVFDRAERNRRALKTLALFWGLAGASAFIIIAHWVLVPGFLLAGPIMAFRKHRIIREIDNASGTCPACSEAITFELEANETLPKRTYCPKCAAPVELLAA